MGAVKKVLFILLMLFLFSSLTKTIADYLQNMSFYQDYKTEYEKEKKRNVVLKTEIIKNNDPYQLEKTIRNNLNLAHENETEIILPQPTEAPITPRPTEAPTWKQWQNVFFSKI